MRIEASSSTSPFSRRSTMVSSSLSACSKLMVLMSEWSVGSAMTWLSPFLHSGSRGGAHQRLDVDGGRARKSIEVVAALEAGDKLAAGMLGGSLQQLLCYPGEIRFHQPELRQRVLDMRIEAG